MQNSENIQRLALSMAEAARAAGISRTVLYEQVAAGTLRTRKLGKRRLVLQSDLESFLQDLQAA